MDVERLLQPVSDAEPCGPDLRYDAAAVELEKLAQGTPEQQMGNVNIAATEPNWKEVRQKASELFTRSKDLRTLLWLALAELREGGLAGFADALGCMRGLHEKYWDAYYPRLDPDDKNDPTERMNVLGAIAAPQDTFGDPYQFVKRVRESVIVSHPQLGKFSVRDIQLAKGEIPVAEGVTPPDGAAIEGCFAQTGVEQLQQVAAVVQKAQDDLKGLGAWLAEKVGHENVPVMVPLSAALTDISKVFASQLAKRGVGGAAGTGEAGAGGPGSGGMAANGGSGGGRLSGEISSSADVLVALDKIIRYYDASECSSPVPLVIKGAQRLVGKNFVEIAKVLTPEAIGVLEKISGAEPPAS